MSSNYSLVPESEKGASSDTISSREFKNKDDAIKLYEKAKLRLLDVSHWDKLCEGPSAQFRLANHEGKTVTGKAQPGYYFRIDIPVPGTESGHGFDWVRIENVTTDGEKDLDIEYITIKVHPSKNPNDNSGETSHFFKEDASSTFIVKRDKNKVTAEIHGRNELPNIDKGNKKDLIRNAVVAITAMLGFSKVQWKQLTEGLLKEE